MCLLVFLSSNFLIQLSNETKNKIWKNQSKRGSRTRELNEGTDFRRHSKLVAPLQWLSLLLKLEDLFFFYLPLQWQSPKHFFLLRMLGSFWSILKVFYLICKFLLLFTYFPINFYCWKEWVSFLFIFTNSILNFCKGISINKKASITNNNVFSHSFIFRDLRYALSTDSDLP